MIANAFSDTTPNPTRAFGRFELRAFLGKSAGTMVWLALDRRAGVEMMLTLPREAPVDAAALARWLDRVRHAARLDHPNLARVAEIGVHDHWPFVAVERGARLTLLEWLAAHPHPAPVGSAGWLCDALHGLAFAHEAGAAHGDPQLHQVLVNERGGEVCMMALGAAGALTGLASGAGRGVSSRGMAMDPAQLRDQRSAAERDVLACGVLLHHLLGGEAPLGIADTARVIERLAPLGREFLRLPWTTPLPVPEALRAIANRATSGQERLRYRGARTLAGALAGWLATEAQDNGGPVAVLIDRLHSVGHLPALPGLAARVARVIALETQRTDEIANQILPDMALSFELLRTLNSAQVQGTQVAGNGPVLTLRRVVALIGVNGVRKAANALRAWPGPLDEGAAARLKKTMERVRLAGHVAQALRPAGYDAEAVFLIAVMQNLGRLMVRYHFADEAEQIEQLMRPADPPRGTSEAPAAPEAPGMTEVAAAFAVLGVEIEAFGSAVARHWGLREEVLHMIRRLPVDAPVRKPDGDAEVLRIVASAANEVVDIVTLLAPQRIGAAFERLAERYARVLHLNARTFHDALQDAREALCKASVPAPRKRAATEPTVPAVLAD
ncbi:MAG TPA: HDOD domain-containing protein [Caldimonas sp.]